GHFNLENGNSEQRTSGGLLVWRKADNWTAFTDGTTTWINGPAGLASRPNGGPLFPWEASAPVATPAAVPDQSQATTPPSPPGASPPTTASQPASANGPITLKPEEISLGLGDMGKQIAQSYLRTGSD